MSISDEERRVFTERDLRSLSTADPDADPAAERLAWAHLVDELGRAMCDGYEHAPSASADSLVPPDPCPVRTAIVLRARARDIRERVLGHRAAVGRAFRVLESPCRGDAWHRRTEALIALSLAAGQARCLGNRLTLLPTLVPPRPGALAEALVTALADSGRALDAARQRLRESAEPGRTIPAAAALTAAASAARLATCLEAEIRAEPIDASDTDLSRVDHLDLPLLAGVIWSRTTIWPDTLAPLSRSHSNRVAPGIYQVRASHP
ncbi:hypothetical protein B4N89_32500 [Embleya scabrispora]|uniref:Uncharacterized protein n=1 Tax=Embleya scabrispora TaxID=159449 RepID=A0A1T3NQ07_9ACTN|nr:hypothetical protein [Embleya scabrispora]OPC78854.1 hypothetical protein B4N89_32500 [Embleya scabrispora]